MNRVLKILLITTKNGNTKSGFSCPLFSYHCGVSFYRLFNPLKLNTNIALHDYGAATLQKPPHKRNTAYLLKTKKGRFAENRQFKK